MLESITQLIGGPKRPKAIERLQRKFLKFFPKGFQDPKYFAWERGYKIEAHQQWDQALNQQSFRKMLKARQYLEVGQIAARIESKTNLLFSFEKMAFRDAVRDPAGAQL